MRKTNTPSNVLIIRESVIDENLNYNNIIFSIVEVV